MFPLVAILCFSRATALLTSESVVHISGRIPRREFKRHDGARGRPTPNTITLDGASFEDEYLVNITVGGRAVSFWIPAGSCSLHWLNESGLRHMYSSDTWNPVPAATCDFGPTQFNPTDSPTFEVFPNHTFFLRYGSGEFLRGPAGFDTVSVGSISVSGQEIGVPNMNVFKGDGVSEGVLGLAFPGLTSIYSDNGTGLVQEQYSPFFLSAIAQKQITNPLLSIALNRPTFTQQAHDPFVPDLGTIAFGGIVPVPVSQHKYITVPMQRYAPKVFVPSNDPTATPLWYSLDVDGYTFSGSSSVVTKSNSTILDSGSTVNFLPTAVAAAYNAQFRPPGFSDPVAGWFVVPCNATAPPFTVHVGGVPFEIDTRDQVVPQPNNTAGAEPGSIFCMSGTQDGGPPDEDGAIFILGDVFYHNVVVTLNPVDSEITLSQRAPY
ncbi:acid protease [Roridomyces roridus]|uniref:Acid protease n=1 Tax=Roridomyces roridus TaxID=1738132 RepID=A0AAD7BIU3_9AGAR|nr:acid protease [Roridomyces roridus]